MNEEKEKLQTSLDYLADLCLGDMENHRGYTDKDLMNATLVLMHFLIDIIYTENKHLSEEGQLNLAHTTGQAIRALILSSTGKDMHEVARGKKTNLS